MRVRSLDGCGNTLRPQCRSTRHGDYSYMAWHGASALEPFWNNLLPLASGSLCFRRSPIAIYDLERRLLPHAGGAGSARNRLHLPIVSPSQPAPQNLAGFLTLQPKHASLSAPTSKLSNRSNSFPLSWPVSGLLVLVSSCNFWPIMR
jgi:hypothetical protein